MSANYHCEHCDAEFLSPEGKLRCPTCLRTTGLTSLDNEAPPRKIPLRTAAGVVALALGLAGGGWYLATQRGAEPAKAPPAGTQVVLPDGENPKPPAPTPPVSPDGDSSIASLAKGLIVGATTDGAKVRQVLTGLHLRIQRHDPDRALQREVMRPAAVAIALAADKTRKPALTGIESGALIVACLDSLGFKPQVVLLTEASRGKTSLRHRSFGARVQVAGVPGVLAPALAGTPRVSDSPASRIEALEANLMGLEAVRQVEQHDFDGAAATIELAVKKAPEDAALRFVRGQLKLLRGQVDDGVEEMEKAVEEAEDAEGRFQLGIALLREEAQFGANQAFSRATELDPKHADAWHALSQVAVERLGTTPEGQEGPIDAELDRIEAALAAIGKLAPGLIELRVQRLILKGKRKEARKLAVEALNMDPKRAPLHLLVAELAKLEGETAIAMRHYERAAESDPEDAEPLVQLAALHEQAQHHDKALAALEKAVERAPYDPALLGELAGFYHQLGRVDDAVKSAEELNKRFPDLVDGPMLLAELMLAKEDGKGAIAVCEQALQSHPKEPTFYVMLYFIHHAEGRADEASKVLARLLKFDPQGRVRIAQQLFQASQFEAGVALMEEELLANPKNLDVAVTLAQMHLLAGHADDVKRLREHVEAQTPDAHKEEMLKLFDQALQAAMKQAQDASGVDSPQAPEQPTP